MAEGAPRAGLLASLRGLLDTGLEIVQTRLALLATEFEEEKSRLLALVVYGALALVFLAAGLVFLAIFFTVLLWDNNRLLVLGIISSLFIGGGLAAIVAATRLARTPSRLFAASLAELAKDREAARTERP